MNGDRLQELCAQRGIQVAKRARKDVMAGLLLADPNGGKARPAELQAMEQHPVRLEQLVLLIAQQVGVPPAAIAQLATPASLPPT